MVDISLPCQVYWRVRTSESQGLFFLLRKIHRGSFLNWCPSWCFLTAQKLKTNKWISTWDRLWFKLSISWSFRVRSTRLFCLYIDIYLSNHEPNQLTTQDSNDHWPPASPASRDGRASRENYAEYIDGTKVDGSHILSSSSTFAWFLWCM